MKKITTLILACFLFLSFSVYSAGINRSVFTTAIVDKEPVSNLKDVSSDITRLYFFTEITGLNGHTISHRWEYNGQVLAEVNFKVNGERWRTWSSKNMISSWLGKWRVSVIDEGGNIIEQNEFNYVKSSPVNESPVTNNVANKNSATEIKENVKQQ